MFGDPSVMQLLSPAQRGILLIHEAMYLIASEKEQHTSENVRKVMREVLRETLDQNSLDAAIQSLGVPTTNPTFTFENISPGKYSDSFVGNFNLNVDLKFRTVQIIFDSSSKVSAPSNLKNLNFLFDSGSLEGREISSSNCDYTMSPKSSGTSGLSYIDLRPRIYANECPIVSLYPAAR